MKAFAQLYATLDASTRTNDKVAALAGYFQAAIPQMPAGLFIS